jgi:rRNA processing protein Krr1/Pno1
MSSDHINNIDTEMAATSLHDQEDQPVYDQVFPPLAGGVGGSAGDAPATSAWSTGTRGPAHKPKMYSLRSSTVTHVFCVPMEERRNRQDANEMAFGERNHYQAKVCQDIMARNNVTIEMSLAKDQSLTVVITGKPENVMMSRKSLTQQLQTQATHTMNIPKEHHRFILGQKGKKLQELELNTATKVNVPRQEENSDEVRITGTKEGIEAARHQIQVISDEQAKLAFERLPVEKLYHPFICGPDNTKVQELMTRTGARINVPPPSVMKDEIVVSGEKEGVHEAIAEIMKIYKEKKRTCQTVCVEGSQINRLNHI